MILPVFALYAENLESVTPLLVGVAISAYGLTQAILQIPFGILSDRWGRKPVITLGLLLFCIGSVVAALADNIYLVILGRAIQGSGAIAAAVLALAADLTAEENRTKAMATIGVSIGMAFALALVAGPVLDAWIGVPGIFWLTAVLALVGIVVLWGVVPQPEAGAVTRVSIEGKFGDVLRDKDLLRLDVGIFILHMMLTAGFVVLPLILRDRLGMDSADHWQIYLPVLVFSLAIMVPFIVVAERRQQMKEVFVGAVFLLGCSQLGLFFFNDLLWGLVASLLLMFTAFNVLEATLPSIISKMAPAASKGAAMGVYTSSQFAGAFLGGLAGGYLHGQYGAPSVYLFCAIMIGLWVLVAMGMQHPPQLSRYLVEIGAMSGQQELALGEKMASIAGVSEAVIQDGVAYLKIDRKRFDEPALKSLTEDIT